MIVFYLIGFLLISAGIVILLGITPEVVTNDMMKFISPKQTLRDKAQIAKGRKKSRRITKEILHIKEALEVTGKGMAGQSIETLHAMLVKSDSQIQGFGDVVIAFLIENNVNKYNGSIDRRNSQRSE